MKLLEYIEQLAYSVCKINILGKKEEKPRVRAIMECDLDDLNEATIEFIVKTREICAKWDG